MKAKKDIARLILTDANTSPVIDQSTAFAPSNIALIKYWGKRDDKLHLPMTSSLSISLGHLGCETSCTHTKSPELVVTHNQSFCDPSSSLYRGIADFLSMLGLDDSHCQIDIKMNIPMAAGVASSACGFAALVKSLNHWYGWDLDLKSQSILARLGSGSACRSFWPGFVEWKKGKHPDGMDSYGVPIDCQWEDFCVALVLTSTEAKTISSRKAMQRTMDESKLYRSWVERVPNDLTDIKAAIKDKDFQRLGEIAESNAIAMHQTMLSTDPPIDYSNEQTIKTIEQVKKLRDKGTPCYYTQDAGPSIKILYLKTNESAIHKTFSDALLACPWSGDMG